MTKPLAAILAALVLVACADAETSPPPGAPVVEAAREDKSANTSGPDADACAERDAKRERKTPTSFEACEGLWRCDPNMGDRWMRPDGDVCVLGRTIQLFADGRVTSQASEGEIKGNWAGDAFYMTLSFEPDAYGVPHEVTCERKPDEPSK